MCSAPVVHVLSQQRSFVQARLPCEKRLKAPTINKILSGKGISYDGLGFFFFILSKSGDNNKYKKYTKEQRRTR